MTETLSTAVLQGIIKAAEMVVACSHELPSQSGMRHPSVTVSRGCIDELREALAQGKCT